MITRKAMATALILGAVAGSIVALQVRAGADEVAFPENWAKGVMYMSRDVPLRSTASATGQQRLAEVREYYATAGAIEALRAGTPIPSGTVMVIARFRAQLDAERNPLKDANGHFVKGELYGFGVMEKRTGWGADRPPEIRNGEWEYQAFTADKKPDATADIVACFQCHKSHANNDYLQTFDQLKAAAVK